MKQNTKLLLVWLYSEKIGERWVSMQSVKKLLSDLSEAGVKSLLFLLEKKQLVLVERIRDEQHVSITSHGKRMLEAQFPSVLNINEQWNGEWNQIVFLKPPKSDLNFRYLRKKLLSMNYVAVSRGVYMFAGRASSSIIDLCDQMYRNSVLIFTIKHWVFGDELNVMGFKTLLADVKSSYSGISKEVERLISKKDSQKRLTESYEIEVYSVFSRLYKTMTSDLGLVSYYFPQEKSAIDLLLGLQKLL